MSATLNAEQFSRYYGVYYNHQLNLFMANLGLFEINLVLKNRVFFAAKKFISHELHRNRFICKNN
jgi:hypothetical protein